MAFLPLRNKDTGINVSNIYSMPAIYIGDEFNKTVVSFKPFLETLTYDFSKETETNNDTEKGSSAFKTSGLQMLSTSFIKSS